MSGIRLRVLTYNVHSQRDDLTALASVVRDIAPDVAILQEAPRRFGWRQGCARLARRTGLVVAAGGLPALGNLVLTTLRVEVSGSECVRFPLTPGRHLRGAVLVSCRIAGTRFAVAGSHFSLDAAERIAQAAVLKEHLGALRVPVILGADLNENSGGSAWRTVADELTDVALAAGREGAGDLSLCPPPGADRRSFHRSPVRGRGLSGRFHGCGPGCQRPPPRSRRHRAAGLRLGRTPGWTTAPALGRIRRAHRRTGRPT